jgi:hypothetical protein
LERLTGVFSVERMPTSTALRDSLARSGETVPAFGLGSADSLDLYLLTLDQRPSVDRLLPPGTSPSLREIDATIAGHAILRHGLGLNEDQMSDIRTLWFTEDADMAIIAARDGRARYAVLLNPVPVRRILAVADAGERMPQKSTFFYPKVPTGLVFNPLD